VAPPPRPDGNPGSKLESWEGSELTNEGRVPRPDGRDDNMVEGRDLTRLDTLEDNDSILFVANKGKSFTFATNSPTVFRASGSALDLSIEETDLISFIDESSSPSKAA
jgi:hypothetical protein